MQIAQAARALGWPRMARRWARVVSVLAIVWSAACETVSAPSSAPRDPVTSTPSQEASLERMEVTTVTTGVRLDPDGYGVLNDEWDYDVGDGVTVAAPTNGMVTLYLRSGGHVLSLVGVASNCSGENLDDRPVVVSMGAITAVRFSVICR